MLALSNPLSMAFLTPRQVPLALGYTRLLKSLAQKKSLGHYALL